MYVCVYIRWYKSDILQTGTCDMLACICECVNILVGDFHGHVHIHKHKQIYIRYKQVYIKYTSQQVYTVISKAI